MQDAGFMNKISNLYRQFGFYYLLKSFFKRFFRHLFTMNSYYLLSNCSDAELDFERNTYIELVDDKGLEDFIRLRVDDTKLESQLRAFIEAGDCYALVAIDGNRVAGWGYVQHSGTYTFGHSSYQLPDGVCLLKNLYVHPEFRGESVGKEINVARTTSIPHGQTAIVFVLSDNKYAMRNLEMLGYQRALEINDYLILGYFHFNQINRLGSESEFAVLSRGFINHE